MAYSPKPGRLEWGFFVSYLAGIAFFLLAFVFSFWLLFVALAFTLSAAYCVKVFYRMAGQREDDLVYCCTHDRMEAREDCGARHTP